MNELKANDEKAKTGKDPDSTFYSVILSNMFAFLQIQTSAMAFTSNTEISNDLVLVRILASEQIHSLFQENCMNYFFSVAVQCMRSPATTLGSWARQ